MATDVGVPYKDTDDPSRHMAFERQSIGGSDKDLQRTINTPGQLAASCPLREGSTALEKSHIIKASAGILFGIIGFNSLITPQFIQVHNSEAEPEADAVPIYTFEVQARAHFALDLSPFGDFFSTGIVVCNSSTLETLTIGADDCWFVGRYT